MKRIILLFSLLFVLTGCSFDQKLDQSKDYRSDLNDGIYKATSTYYDSYGFKKNLEISVTKGIISDVTFTEVLKNGAHRIDTANLQSWSNCELTYSQIISNLYEQTIFKQGDSIDVITGATKTCQDFAILLDSLMNAAILDDHNNINVDLFNDTYTVQNEIDPLTGSQEQLIVKFANGNIESIEIKEVSDNKDLTPVLRNYQNLAKISEVNKSLEAINLTSVDQNILQRYNELLENIESLRN